jgi:hypothetical protein
MSRRMGLIILDLGENHIFIYVYIYYSEKYNLRNTKNVFNRDYR